MTKREAFLYNLDELKKMTSTNHDEVKRRTFTAPAVFRHSLENSSDVNVEYQLKKQNKSEWEIESVKFSITKNLWNEQMSHVTRRVALMTSKSKSVYLTVK